MRTRTLKALYTQEFDSYDFDGVYKEVFGQPERDGAWMIWGMEKNGKTWTALDLANYFSRFVRTLYVSAEEGIGKNFVQSIKRAKIDPANRQLKFVEYITLDELDVILGKRRAFKVVFLDNMTIYNEEMKYGRLKDLLKKHRNVLFVILAHEERGEPYTSGAKLLSKLAKVIIHVEGLKANVSGRCPGGNMIIDEQKAQLCWGTEI